MPISVPMRAAPGRGGDHATAVSTGQAHRDAAGDQRHHQRWGADEGAEKEPRRLRGDDTRRAAQTVPRVAARQVRQQDRPARGENCIPENQQTEGSQQRHRLETLGLGGRPRPWIRHAIDGTRRRGTHGTVLIRLLKIPTLGYFAA